MHSPRITQGVYGIERKLSENQAFLPDLRLKVPLLWYIAFGTGMAKQASKKQYEIIYKSAVMDDSLGSLLATCDLAAPALSVGLVDPAAF